MALFFYELLNSPVFWIIWVALCLAYVARWQGLIQRAQKLLDKPIITKHDPEPKSVPIYPRGLLEDFAGTVDPREKHDESFFTSLRNQALDRANPMRTIGYFLFLVFFVIVVFADIVAIANTLRLTGIWSNPPAIFLNYWIAVLAGSTIATIVSFVYFLEFQREQGRLMPDRDARERASGKVFSAIIFILTLIVLIALVFDRLIEIRTIANPSEALQTFVDLSIFGIAPLNLTFAAALMFTEALMGLAVVFVLLGPFFWKLIDLISRVLYLSFDLAVWFVSTPFLAVLAVGKRFYDWARTSLSGGG